MTPDNDPFDDAPESLNGDSGAAPSGGEPSVRGAKVELDIDDAPFLEEPEEEKPKPAPAAPKPAPAQQSKAAAAAASFKDRLKALLADKKKLAILIGALALVFVVLPLALLLTFTLGKKASAPVAPAPERIVVSGVPQREDAPPGPTFLYRLGGFFIERRGSEGELRFLRASFAIPMENPMLFVELGSKDVAVRDAIYYYLQNKPLTFLADKETREMLKTDLLSVINEHISSEKITELFFEEYLISGS